MAYRAVCGACGKRLRLPEDGTVPLGAECPRCRAPVDLSAARGAAAHPAAGAAPPLLDDEPSARRARPAPAAEREEDPLPYPIAPAKPPRPTPAPEPLLSLDDDPAPPDGAPEPVPFRVPAVVVADSHRTATGPCVAVLLPHGLYLEREPLKPFLFVPVGAGARAPAPGELAVTLADGRALAVRFPGRAAAALARDAAAFLRGERPVPGAAEYRFKWWVAAAGGALALALAAGPVAWAEAAELGRGFGARLGAAFALAGLLANAAAAALVPRRAAGAQVLAMAAAGALLTGTFFFGAAAYLAGRQRGYEEAAAEPTPAPAEPLAPAPGAAGALVEPGAPEPRPDRPPSHLDRARKNGASALDDAPAPVTALELAPDGNTLGIGLADGGTRLWPLDQPTFEPPELGPTADGPVARVDFDSKVRFVFAHTASGVVVAPRGAAAAPLAKIPGAPVAICPELSGDRVRFAAVRAGAIQHRLLPTAFVTAPPKRTRDFVSATPKDEVFPLETRDPPVRPGPTFLGWAGPTRLVAGQPNGTVLAWGLTMRPEAPATDHRAAVRAWARRATGDFATGDDKGTVGFWSAKGGKPALWPVFEGTPVTGLSFNASGTRLAATDATGWLVIWDVAAGKALHRVKRPVPAKALVYGPTDDVLVLASGRTVTVWAVAELLK